ncbi:MAG: hypothetical protein JNM06_08865, partial [Blastocatellia bacterium]|nr:hypothetical protein [Blastocatellia bacterium]
RFNIPDFNSFNETKNINRSEVKNNSFEAQLDGISVRPDNTSSPLKSDLTSIAQSTDFNNSISSRVAIDKAARSFVSNLISPELSEKINMDSLLSAMSDFAQNDPIMSQKLQRLLVRLS